VPTWTDTREWLATRYAIADLGPARLALACRMPGEPPALQQVLVEHGRALGAEPWIVLIAAVQAPGAIAPEDALRHNAGLAVGALALIGDRLVLRHAAPLATLDLDALDRAIQVLAAEALRLRRPPGPSPSAIAFQGYED
jgi:hypothetical protein